jgi:superfamily II DNA/RNA helicase
MNSFSDLGVESIFVEKLKERFIEKPTEIQSLVVPRLLDGKNIVFRSATGTGKTFAYLLPVLQALSAEKENNSQQGLSVLICAPTLELCSQIKAEIDFLSPNKQAALLIGSVKIESQIETLKRTRPSVAVGNPGRLLVLAKMGKLKFNSLKFLILDEADRLTAQECIEETNELLAVIEKGSRRRMVDDDEEESGLCLAACSATVGAKTAALLGPLFKGAEIIESEDNEILRDKIEHWAIFSEKRRKLQTLRSLLAAIKTKKSRAKTLVFTSRGDEAGIILLRLQHHHVSAAGLFGKIDGKPLSGAERKEALDSFREGKVDVLVSTDLAARGLDISGITHVIAMDVPADGEVYIHRCGRTARAGKRGVMVTVGDETQMRLLASLEKKLKIRVCPKELHYGQICAPLPIE